ncbi:MAG: DUF1876 domain-containing protein [Acidimicrobiia bacterium]|nr:DUF1876 domain-containing protein [Acidimicrobiia bacterium]
MKAKGDTRVWTVEVFLEETHDETEAKAVLEVGDTRFGGWGRARRNPSDPELPRVGEELAAARALSDLSHKLLDAAAETIEAYEGRSPRLHG